MSGTSVLRAVANRLTLTPIEDLPSQVGYLATSVASCRSLLQNSTSSSEHGILLHKLRTRVSALLQDRTPEGRFCGIVMAKAIVEAGGSTMLVDSGNWVRAIISCLNKSDPTEVKKLGVLTVTRIYFLTAEHQQMVREITTPTLPAFISATLSIIRPETSNVDGKLVRALSPLLAVIISSWYALLEHFPSTIRPNATSMRSICLSLVSDEASSTDDIEAACQVLARLHYCAPKNTAGTEWARSCSQVIDAVHDTTDLVFRAVVEDWIPSTNRLSKVTRKQKSSSAPTTTSPDPTGLDAWSGVSQGSSRIISQLIMLQKFLTSSHISEVNIPLGALFDLTSRLTAVTIPTSKYSPRTNNDITREEREELWLNLPRIHVAILKLYRALIFVFGHALLPVCDLISTQVWDIFEAEQAHETVRASTYLLVTSMLGSRLIRFSKTDSANARLLVKYCCGDLSSTVPTSTAQISLTSGSSAAVAQNDKNRQSGDPRQSNLKRAPVTRNHLDLYSSAYGLLPVLLTYGHLHQLEASSTIRAQLDSTAILLNHHEAILASVLNPPGASANIKRGINEKATPSLIPFLTRSMESGGATSMSNAERLGYEALLRPRMPIIPTQVGAKTSLSNSDEQDEDSIADEEDIVMLDEQSSPEQVSNGDTAKEASKSFINKPGHIFAPHVSLQSVPQPHNTKRDFTTLIEQSANEQLAASAAEITTNAPNQPKQNIPISTPATKRPKTTVIDTATATATTLLPDPDPNPQHLTSTSTLEFSTAQTPTIVEDIVPPSSVSDKATTAKQRIDPDDSSSDSDVPLIDATLVGISDSEDDDDDDEGFKV